MKQICIYAVALWASTGISQLFGRRQLSFAPPVTYATAPGPEGPYPIARADLNGDGKVDIVVSNNGSNSLSVFLGNGDGTLQPGTLVTVGSGPVYIVVGDFNRDGKPDLAVANQFDNTVSVLIGNGDGTFQPKVDYPVGNEPYSLAVGDFNGDRKLDLAVGNNQDGTVSILLGRGNGTFRQGTIIPNITGPHDLAVGDFNGDGKKDIAVVNDVPEQVSDLTILLGKGDGTFQVLDTGYDFGDRPEGIVVADFNGDGIADVAVPSELSNEVSVLIGKGDGTFQAPKVYPLSGGATSAQVADFDLDGKHDLAVSGFNFFHILLGNGDGTFQPDQSFATGCSGSSYFVATTLNHDRRPDIVTSNLF